MNKQRPHNGEKWTHKDGSGLVIIDAMFEDDTYYVRRDDEFFCDTKTFKKMYMKV